MAHACDNQVKAALYTELSRATRPVAVQRIVSSLQTQKLVVDNRDATVVVQKLGKCSLWANALDAVMRLAWPGLLQPDAVLLGAMVTACGRGNAWTQSLGCQEPTTAHVILIAMLELQVSSLLGITCLTRHQRSRRFLC